MATGSQQQTFFDVVHESILRLQVCKEDESITKADVIDEMESRLSLILKKMISTPSATSYSMFRSESGDVFITMHTIKVVLLGLR